MGRAVPVSLRVVGLALALALAAAPASCGSPPDAAVVPTITASPTADPGPSAAPTGSAPTGNRPSGGGPTSGGSTGGWGAPDPEPTGFGEPSTEPTVVRTTTRDDGGTVTVSGPTVNNRYQEVFVDFSRIPDHCAFLVNEDPRTGDPATKLDARVVDLRITRQTPAGSTAFRYYDPDAASDACLPGLVQSVVRPCRGAVLPPADDATGTVGCPTGIAFSGTPGTDYTARFVVTLEVECTSPQKPPCDLISGREPSAAAPVKVRWNSGTDLRACLGTAGGPGHAESRGLCVHEEVPTTEPTSTEPTSTGPTSTGPTSTGPTSTGPTS